MRTERHYSVRAGNALGYSEFDEVEHGSAQASGTFPDYVLRASGKRVMAVEAKRFGAALGDREASQLVSYCAVVGVRRLSRSS